MAKKYTRYSKLGFYGWSAIGLVMLFSSWGLVVYYKPIISETSCSEMAANTSSIYLSEKYTRYTDFDYSSIKSKCLEASY